VVNYLITNFTRISNSVERVIWKDITAYIVVSALLLVMFAARPLTVWGPTSRYARQCVPLHQVQRQALLDTLYCDTFCRFQEALAICNLMYEFLGG
jgi:hypothetical protein